MLNQGYGVRALQYRPNSIAIHPWGHESGGALGRFSGSSASATWPTSNLAISYPFQIARPFTAVAMFLYNGAAVSGNFDIGIYDDGAGTTTLNKIVSMGSTAQSGTNDFQFANITDTTLSPGRYYAVLCFDNTTATVFTKSSGNVGVTSAAGWAQTANGAVTLGSTLTIAKRAAAGMPFFGLSAKASF